MADGLDTGLQPRIATGKDTDESTRDDTHAAAAVGRSRIATAGQLAHAAKIARGMPIRSSFSRAPADCAVIS